MTFSNHSGGSRQGRAAATALFAATLLLQAGGAAAGETVAERYKARRQSVLDKLPPRSAALLVGGEEPEYGEFHREPNFFYLTGQTRPHLFLILTPETSGPREILISPLPDSSKLDWTGYVVPADSLRTWTGVETVVDTSKLTETLSALLSKTDTIYCLDDGWEVAGRVRDNRFLLGFLVGDMAPPRADLAPLVTELRLVKDEDELGLITRAVAITGESLVAAFEAIGPGVYEYEIEAAIEGGFTSRGARITGFPPIVASGPNSCILHYRMNKRRMEPGDLLLMDIGAEFEEYTADITRTVPVSGRFSGRQREIYELVLQAQKKAIAAVKPGVSLRDVHQVVQDLFEKAGLADNYPHFTSHFLGLAVHDPGSKDVRLRPGMVLTVEPGIYITEEEIGIRIEDDVVVTESGCRVISADIPKEIDEIEVLMREGR